MSIKEGNVVVDGFNEGTWLAVGVAERVGESVGSSWWQWNHPEYINTKWSPLAKKKEEGRGEDKQRCKNKNQAYLILDNQPLGSIRQLDRRQSQHLPLDDSWCAFASRTNQFRPGSLQKWLHWLRRYGPHLVQCPRNNDNQHATNSVSSHSEGWLLNTSDCPWMKW